MTRTLRIPARGVCADERIASICRSTFRRQPSGCALMHMKPRDFRLIICSGIFPGALIPWTCVELCKQLLAILAEIFAASARGEFHARPGEPKPERAVETIRVQIIFDREVLPAHMCCPPFGVAQRLVVTRIERGNCGIARPARACRGRNRKLR